MSKQEKPGEPSALQRAALLVEKLQTRLETVERARTEPIAVIGMGCRFPGGAVDGPSYWKLLRDGVDALSEVPGSRWDVPGHYDSSRVSPERCTESEAASSTTSIASMPTSSASPRARRRAWIRSSGSLLEVAWEALEDAGLSPDRARWQRDRRLHRRDRPATTWRACCRERRDPLRRHTRRRATRTASPPGRLVYVLGPAGAVHGGRHRLLVVAGRAPPGLREPAGR